jgi:hypothetical protein
MKKLKVITLAALAVFASSFSAQAAQVDANAVWDEHLLSLLQEETKVQSAEETKANADFTNAFQGQILEKAGEPASAKVNRAPAKSVAFNQ